MEPTGFFTPGTTHIFCIPSLEELAQESARLDLFLHNRFPVYSRTFFKQLIQDGQVLVNDKPTKGSALAIPGATVTINFPAQEPLAKSVHDTKDLAVQIVYEHDQFLIVNKPAGLTVHSAGAGHNDVTLVDWLVTHFSDIKQAGLADRPGIVHRLDKGTSGLMIVARNNYAHMLLSDMFKNREMHKTYLALVHGLPEKERTIDLAIMRHPTQRTKMATSINRGRPSQTHYVVETYFEKSRMSLIEAHPITGRTHQIRVHLAAVGHALVGDAQYGSSSHLITRPALHAYKLSFTFAGQTFEFEQQPPADFTHLVSELRQQNF